MASNSSRNGADALIETAVHNGVTLCFANPGTTELHLVQAIDRNPDMRAVLCAFEGVCSGAADAYARMTGVPALSLFHLGPGFANSLANEHNARRHGTPMINIIGDHTTWHLEHDSPLTSNIELLGDWVGETRYVGDSTDVANQMAAAIGDTLSGDPRIVSLVLPTDVAWGDAPAGTPEADIRPSPGPDAANVKAAAAGLSAEGGTMIVGGPHISTESIRLIGRIRKATGCTVYSLRPGRVEIGATLPDLNELPYFAAPLRRALADTTTAVMVGRTEPVTFFGYPDTPSQALPEGAERVTLCGRFDDMEASLAALADELGADADEAVSLEPLPDLDPGPLNTKNLGIAFLESIESGDIVIGEGLTSFGTYRKLASHADTHTLLGVQGGAIGGGLPAAVGAALACPDRSVLSFQADGSSLYTIQALWTMAREQLDVTVVLAANRRYQILDVEFSNHDMDLSDKGKTLTDLDGISFAGLAEGFGVASRTVDTGADLKAALDWAKSEPGPHLIEANLAS